MRASAVDEEEEKKEESTSSSHRLSEDFESAAELFELRKGVQLETSKVKQLYRVQKEAKKGNLIKNVSAFILTSIQLTTIFAMPYHFMQLVINTETRHLALINGNLYSFQIINQPNKTIEAAHQLKDSIKDQIKEIDTQKIKKSFTSFFQRGKEKLTQLTSKGGGQQSTQPPSAAAHQLT